MTSVPTHATPLARAKELYPSNAPDAALARALLALAERLQAVNVEFTAAVAPHVSCDLTKRDRMALTTRTGLSAAAAGLARLAEMFSQEAP